MMTHGVRGCLSFRMAIFYECSYVKIHLLMNAFSNQPPVFNEILNLVLVVPKAES